MITSAKLHGDRIVRRSPVYYGWVVWAVAALGTVATSPGQSFSVSLFFDFFIRDFGLDRTTASGLYGLGTLLGSLSLTWVGRQIDRLGNRRMAAIISALFALALFAFSLITGPLGLLLGFIAIRGLGQGALGLVSSTVVAQWFMRRRGRVLSLTVVAMSVFQSVYVPWLQGLLESYEWRQVWIILGAGVAVTILPLGWLLMRDRPESFGLLPDGAAATDEAVDQAAQVSSEDDWTLNEAMRSLVFWVFMVARMLMAAWGTGLIIHQLSLFASFGHDATVVAGTFSIFALIAAGSAILSGVLVDRFRPGVIVALQMAAMSVALLMATMMTQTWMLILYALGFGFAQGSGGVFEGAVWANLFGRTHLGAIRGLTLTTLVASSAVGPIVFGLSFDLLGGYTPVLWIGILWALVAGVLGLWVKPPRRPASGEKGTPDQEDSHPEGNRQQ